MKFKDFADTFKIETLGGGKMRTKIKPSERSFKNIPKYSDGKNRVDFRKWLLIKGEGSKKLENGMRTPHYYGKSEADGKWYGFSHRAVYGFKIGDKITGKSMAKKVIYSKDNDGIDNLDNGKYEPDFTIKDDAHAKKVAIRFAENVS